MNFKRKKSKRSIRCSLCTKYRWYGNGAERSKPKYANLSKRKAIHESVE